MDLWPSALSIRYACILELFRPSIVTYKRVSRRQIISLVIENVKHLLYEIIEIYIGRQIIPT